MGVSKVVSPAGTVLAGSTLTYTITVSNTSSNGAPAGGTQVSDTPPAGLTNVSWTCAASGGGACPAASGSGALSATLTSLPAGASVVYTLQGTVPATQANTTVVNTATLSVPANVSCASNCSASASTTVTALVPDLTIGKSASAAQIGPGGSIGYTLTVKNDPVAANAGPLFGGTVTVTDPLPTGLTASLPVTATGWDCAASTASAVSCTYSGAYPIAVGATLGSPIQINAALVSSGSVSGTLTNTASVSTPTAEASTANNSASASVGVTPLLSLAKTASTSAALAPGASVSYTVTARNVGVSSADGAVLSDPVPSGIASMSWTCTPSGGAVLSASSGSGALSATFTSLPVGGQAVCSVSATVSATPPAVLTNTASLNSAITGAQCAGAGNTRSSVPCSASVSNASTPVLSLTKSSSGSAGIIAGGSVTYTLQATNQGSASADGATISDALPAGVSAFSWNCVASGGAVCPAASGSGALSQTIANWPAGGVLTYTVQASVQNTLSASSLTNSASVSPAANSGGICATPAHASAVPPCTASVTDPVLQATVALTSSVSPSGGALAGTALTYTVDVSNTSANGAPAGGSLLSYSPPAALTGVSWTCVASGGAVCPAASGSGPLSETLAVWPAGGALRYTLTGTIAVSQPTGTLTATGTLTPAANVACGTRCTSTLSTPVTALVRSVSVGKTVNPSGTVLAGSALTYTVTVTNTGSGAADGTVLRDTLPSALAGVSWTCAASGGAVCPSATGSGDLNQTITALPAGGRLVYAVQATLTRSASGTVTNTAQVTPATGQTPAVTCSPCSASATNNVTPLVPAVSITKTVSPSRPVLPGDKLTYTITVTSTGNTAADGTVVVDTLPKGLLNATWTCQASGGAVCPAVAGSGDVNETLATFPQQSQVVYTIVAQVSASVVGSLNNVATATPPAGPGGTSGSTGTSATATASNMVQNVPTIPTLGQWAQAVLVLWMLATVAARQQRGVARRER